MPKREKSWRLHLFGCRISETAICTAARHLHRRLWLALGARVFLAGDCRICGSSRFASDIPLVARNEGAVTPDAGVADADAEQLLRAGRVGTIQRILIVSQ